MSSSIERTATGWPNDVLRSGAPAVLVVRTHRGWSVLAPGRADAVADLVEGMSLADLVVEELGGPVDPDRSTRRAARGSPGGPADPGADPRDARLAELERTVAQLEHALAARVATERAIGVLAERHGTTPRSAFEQLRGEARSTGRPVQELARQVLDGLEERAPEPDGAAAPLTLVPRTAAARDGGSVGARLPAGAHRGTEGRS